MKTHDKKFVEPVLEIPSAPAGVHFNIHHRGRFQDVSYQGTLEVSPLRISKTFGKGDADGGDDCKVSRTYTFRSSEDSIYCIYDYKSTSLYSSDLPTPRKFWIGRDPHRFSLAWNGKGENPAIFVDWFFRTLHARAGRPKSAAPTKSVTKSCRLTEEDWESIKDEYKTFQAWIDHALKKT